MDSLEDNHEEGAYDSEAFEPEELEVSPFSLDVFFQSLSRTPEFSAVSEESDPGSSYFVFKAQLGGQKCKFTLYREKVLIIDDGTVRHAYGLVSNYRLEAVEMDDPKYEFDEGLYFLQLIYDEICFHAKNAETRLYEAYFQEALGAASRQKRPK